jgi:hypothetical protein
MCPNSYSREHRVRRRTEKEFTGECFLTNVRGTKGYLHAFLVGGNTSVERSDTHGSIANR